jgi:hypothetical protein
MRARALLVLAAALSLAQEAPLRPSGSSPPPQVAALFYAWYDAPGSHFRRADGADAQRFHFVAPGLVHAASPEWFEKELADLSAAGVDVLLAANVPATGRAAGRDAKEPPVWMAALRTALERTNGRLERPVRVALLLDPVLVAVERAGGEAATKIEKLDLEAPAQLAAFLAPIEAFFATFSEGQRAAIEGEPLLLLGSATAITTRPDDLLDRIARLVTERAGRAPHLVVERSWQRADLPTWRIGSALLGPQIQGDVACLGPGYDDRRLTKGAGLLRLRERGASYAAAWTKVLAAKPKLVLLDSWNQLHDGSSLCETIEHGRAYVEATRRFSDLLRAGATLDERPALRFPYAVRSDAWIDERDFVLRDDLEWRPDALESGITLAPESDARLAFGRDERGATLEVRPAAGSGLATVRFLVSRSFDDPGAGGCEAKAVAEGAAGPDSFRVRLEAGALVLESKAPSLVLRSLELRRARGRLPEERSGVHDPGFLDAVTTDAGRGRARAAAAKARGAAWLRFDFDGSRIRPGTEASPGAEEAEVQRLARAVGIAREAGLEPLVVLLRPPVAPPPPPGEPGALGELVRRIAATCPDLRFLELFPDSNALGDASRAPDPQGHVLRLREAARAAREANPRLALVLGGVAGPDVAWLRTLGELRETFAYDAISLLSSDEYGERGGASFELAWRSMVRQLEGGADSGKPYFLEFDEGAARSPLLAPERRALLPSLLAAACKRLEREPTPVDLLAEPELPRPRGLAPEHARELLEGGGLAVRPRQLAELIVELDADRVRTLVLPQGEVVPRELVPRLPAFLDRGGLLVTVGGAPFRRTAVQRDGGGFELEEDAAAALTLRDELRVALAGAQPGRSIPFPARRWCAGAAFPELEGRFDPPPLDGAWFVPRTGLPRNEHGFHRYDPLLTARTDAGELGEVAALIAFSGARRGALLLVGVDAEDRGSGDRSAAFARARELALSTGARVVFERARE